jgi:hypothetical protein
VEVLSFPQTYRMVHRVRLTVRKRSYDLIGYLAINGSCLRAVAVSEMGGTLFDLLACPGTRKVLKSPHRLPVRPLKTGVLNQLAHLFAHLPPGSGGDDTGTRLMIESAGKQDQASQQPQSLVLVRGKTLLARIDIQTFRRIEGWPYPVPGRFRVIDTRWGFTMQVELLRMDMRPVDKKVFTGK